MKKAINRLKHAGDGFVSSKFYQTAPISAVPQPDFINCACLFYTPLSFNQITLMLETIEKELGKTPKPKEAPRVIDIDVLFFGDKTFSFKTWEVPHPRWSERLFVLKPLEDLMEVVALDGQVIEIQPLIARFSPQEIEQVKELNL